MQEKIFTKYFTACAAIILSVLIVMGSLCSFVLARQTISETSSNLNSAAHKISAMYASAPKNGYLLAGLVMENAMDVVKETLNAEVIVVGAGGKTAYSTVEDASAELPGEAVQWVLAGNVYEKNGVFLKVQGKAKSAYTVGVPIMADDNQLRGAVFVTTTNINVLSTLTPFFLAYTMFMLIALGIAFFIIYFVTVRMFRPLTQMRQAARAYADGDFSMRVQVRHNDEIGELASAFNNMADSLNQLETLRRGFVEDVSHELRTPMTSIAGFIDGILDGVIEPEDQPKYLKIVSDEIKRLSRMVSSMLDVAKIQSGTMVYTKTDFDLLAVISKNLMGFEERLTEKQVKLVWDIGSEEYVHADIDAVYRVVYNLLDNALKFVDEGGIITIRTELRDDKLLTAIRNTGEGIPPQDAGHIFERFYKTDKSRSKNKKGVGIGLYLVNNIVKDLGGDIFVSSKEGSFAEFSFTLPVSPNLEGQI